MVGYELFNRARPPHGPASDTTLVFTALSHADDEELASTKLLFVNCTHESLTSEDLDLLPPEKLVLEIPALGHATDEAHARLPILAALRNRGFRLAFGHWVLESVYAAWLPLADYIRFDLSILAPDQLTVLTNIAHRLGHAELLAAKVENAQQFNLAVSLGIRLFQGFWFSRPTVLQTRLLTPAQQNIVQLITLVREQADIDAIEEILKKDAGLAFNLLRLINSAGFGVQREITSFRQAVLLMGLKKLFRWAAMLLAASRDSGLPPAVGQSAIIRGRLMELLAQRSQPAVDEDQAFVTGVFSRLDHMLGLSLETAIALIPVPDAVSAAVLRHEGALGKLLAIAEACDNLDARLDDQEAHDLSLASRQIDEAHLQAIAWTDHLADA